MSTKNDVAPIPNAALHVHPRDRDSPLPRSGKQLAAAAWKRQLRPETQTGANELNWKLRELENMREAQATEKHACTKDHHRSLARKRSRGAQSVLTQGQRDAIAKRQHHLV